jgi:flagellin
MRALNDLRLSGVDLTRSVERLSSGLRVNRASDDAATLSIHHREEAQVRGLAQAARNVQDGISATRVADGGLATITNLLQRGRELAVQAANDTLGVTQRTSLQDELTQLVSEVDNVATNTTFNGLALLAGGVAPTQTFTVNPGETIDVGRVIITAGTPNLVINAPFGVDAGAFYPDLRVTAPNGQQFGYTSPFLNSGAPVTDTTNTASSSATYTGFNALNEQMTFNNPIAGEWIIRLNNMGAIPVTVTMSSSSPLAAVQGSMTLQIGADANQTFTLGLADARSAVLGVNNMSLLTGSSAGSAITALDAAIAQVSRARSDFGAAENALEAHVRSVETAREAAQAADSRLVDADMASEMMDQVRAQILSASGMSTLASMNLDARRQNSALLAGLLTELPASA